MPQLGKKSLPVSEATHKKVAQLKVDTGKPMERLVDEAIDRYAAWLKETGEPPGSTKSTHGPKELVGESSKIVLQETGDLPEAIQVEPEVLEWLQRLRFILERGDSATREAITRNLERFHLLTMLLSHETESTEISESPSIPTDYEARISFVREAAARYGISWEDLRTDAGGSKPPKRKHPAPTGTRRKH